MQIFHEDGVYKLYLAGEYIGSYPTQDAAIQAGYNELPAHREKKRTK